MLVAANTTFDASIVIAQALGSPPGVRIEVPITRAIVSFWRQASLVGGVWTVTTEAPVDEGEYLLVWRTGDPEPPEFEVFIPLTVVAVSVAAAVSGVDFPDLSESVELIRPSVEDISVLENTRTAAGGGGEIGEFTENTRPSVDEVELLIDQAVGAVLAQLPNLAPEEYFERVKHAVALYTATLIEGSFFREELGSSSVDLWRTLFNTSILSLQRSLDAELRQSVVGTTTLF